MYRWAEKYDRAARPNRTWYLLEREHGATAMPRWRAPVPRWSAARGGRVRVKVLLMTIGTIFASLIFGSLFPLGEGSKAPEVLEHFSESSETGARETEV